MLNARALASVLLVLVVMLAGCVSEETVEEAFPEFELEDGLTNATVSKSMMDGEPWVAYISASWCRHCHPTLDAVDQVIPRRPPAGVQQRSARRIQRHGRLERRHGSLL